MNKNCHYTGMKGRHMMNNSIDDLMESFGDLTGAFITDFFEGNKRDRKKDLDELFRGRNRQVIAPAIIMLINEMAEYWPMTVRQVFYQLVSKELVANSIKEYKNVSKVLADLRIHEHVSWDAIEDRSRRIIEKRGVTDLEVHLKEKAESLFGYYNRCLVQNQGNYCEVWTEKDALTGIIADETWIYCTRIVVARGNASTTYLHQYAERARAATKRGQKPVILYIGDLDPSGARMPVTTQERLKTRHNINVEIRRLALNPDQVAAYRLPCSIEPKKTDTNYRWFVERYGNINAVEVDSLHPKTLREIIKTGLESCLDVEDMVEQQKIQNKEREKLKRLESAFRFACRKENVFYWDLSQQQDGEMGA